MAQQNPPITQHISLLNTIVALVVSMSTTAIGIGLWAGSINVQINSLLESRRETKEEIRILVGQVADLERRKADREVVERALQRIESDVKEFRQLVMKK